MAKNAAEALPNVEAKIEIDPITGEKLTTFTLKSSMVLKVKPSSPEEEAEITKGGLRRLVEILCKEVGLDEVFQMAKNRQMNNMQMRTMLNVACAPFDMPQCSMRATCNAWQFLFFGKLQYLCTQNAFDFLQNILFSLANALCLSRKATLCVWTHKLCARHFDAVLHMDAALLASLFHLLFVMICAHAKSFGYEILFKLTFIDFPYVDLLPSLAPALISILLGPL